MFELLKTLTLEHKAKITFKQFDEHIGVGVECGGKYRALVAKDNEQLLITALAMAVKWCEQGKP